MTEDELRDMFANAAPTEIPDWFVVPDLPPAPPFYSWASLPEEDRAELRKRVSGIDPQERIQILRDREELMNGPFRMWQIECKEIRFFAWRWHYANMMLLSRRKSS